MKIEIEIGFGELIDRIVILELKIKNDSKINRTRHYQECLAAEKEAVENLSPANFDQYLILKSRLYEVNATLWRTEDLIRQAVYDNQYAELSKDIISYNDQRSALKKQLDLMFNGVSIESKSYSEGT
jgi:hypothetical protein